MKKNNQRIISIVGPTATGKTKKALEIARESLVRKEFTGIDIISVDSRQVYQGLEVLTGADVPVEFVPRHTKGERDCFSNHDSSIKIFGVSTIKTQDEWSVAHFKNFAREIIKNSWQQNRLVILVGGTGLYHQHLFNDDPVLTVPPNLVLRSRLESMLLDELQTELVKINSERFQKMNHSDKANKRRLIRAIEVGANNALRKSQCETSQIRGDINWSKIKIETISLTASLAELEQRINLRVTERFIGGAVKEVKQLLKLDLPSSAPVLSTLGVPEITKFLQGELSAEECQKLWSLHEFQYAKRQLTWWKK